MTQILDLTGKYRPRKKPARHWMDMSIEERKAAVQELGLPAFRAKQISKQYFSRLSDDPNQWSDLPAEMRAQVSEKFFPQLLTKASEQFADEYTTIKTAWQAFDGAVIESVLMGYPSRNTICISSEAGCGMACPFCATGQGGLQRNLSAGEIVWQVRDAVKRLTDGSLPISGALNNIVFMGMGEPMANYNAVMQAIRQIVSPDPDGLGISARGVTVSTVGMVPRINQLATEGLPLTLALSLHAPDDELRDELVPLNKRFNVATVLDAAWEYAKATKRRVSIEYILIKDINDQAWRAELLAKKLLARGDWGWCHVNLIPLNPTPGSKWTKSRAKDERAFVAALEAAGVPVTVRDTRGKDIDGACGQLAANLTKNRGAQATNQD